jgi:hypothetical protein
MANQAVLLYQEFVHRNANKFNALKSSKKAITKELTQLYKAASSNKLPENPAVLHDSLSNMIKLASLAGEVDIIEDAKKVLDKIENEITFDDANAALFDLKTSIDTAALPNMMINLCDVINQNLPKEPDELEKLVKPLCDELQERIQSTIDKMSFVSVGFCSIGQDLGKKFKDFIKAIKEKVVPKVMKALKPILDMIEKIQLWLIENKLRFAKKISELARKKKWDLKEVVLGMPEFTVNSVEILGFKLPIPIPSVKGSIVFTPFPNH